MFFFGRPTVTSRSSTLLFDIISFSVLSRVPSIRSDGCFLNRLVERVTTSSDARRGLQSRSTRVGRAGKVIAQHTRLGGDGFSIPGVQKATK